MLFSKGQMSDHKGSPIVLDALRDARCLIADKSYDSTRFREELVARGIEPCIPSSKSRKKPYAYHKLSIATDTRSKTCSPSSRSRGGIATRCDRCPHTFSAARSTRADFFFFVYSRPARTLATKSAKIFAFAVTRRPDGKRARKLGVLAFSEVELGELVASQATDGYHQIGLTRIGRNREEGAVDLDSRVFDLGNLYVAGSSVFVTSGQANPTLPAVAFGARLAQHLATIVTSGKIEA
jgi:choline dehydrogenase-like flavoprotein